MKLSTFLATMAVSSGLLFSATAFAQASTHPAPVKDQPVAHADAGCSQVQAQCGMGQPAKKAAPMKKKAKPVKSAKRNQRPAVAPRPQSSAPAHAPVPPVP